MKNSNSMIEEECERMGRILAKVHGIITEECEQSPNSIGAYSAAYTTISRWTQNKLRDIHDNEKNPMTFFLKTAQLMAQCPLADFEKRAERYIQRMVASN